MMSGLGIRNCVCAADCLAVFVCAWKRLTIDGAVARHQVKETHAPVHFVH